MTATIQKWGNSQGLRLAKHLLEEAHLHVGDQVNVEREGEKIIISPASKVRNRYDIRELVARMPEHVEVGEVLDDQAGREVW